MEGTYENGKISGAVVLWSPAGKKIGEGPMNANAEKHGRWKEWQPEKNAESQGDYANDLKEGEWATVQDGVRLVGSFKKGKAEGSFFSYAPTHRLGTRQGARGVPFPEHRARHPIHPRQRKDAGAARSSHSRRRDGPGDRAARSRAQRLPLARPATWRASSEDRVAERCRRPVGAKASERIGSLTRRATRIPATTGGRCRDRSFARRHRVRLGAQRRWQ